MFWIGGWTGLRANLGDMEKRKILEPTGTRTQTLLSFSPQPVAIPTALFRLIIIIIIIIII
jgi:hypothetical protein